MLVVLLTKSSRTRSQRIQLRTNQVAKFGRSDWADFSFVDPTMSEVHFEVRCAPDGCRVWNLSNDAGTFVNGQEIDDVVKVHHGDEIRAGETSFTVSIEGEVARPAADLENDAVEPAASQDLVAAAAVALVTTCARLEFSEDVQEMAKVTPDADELIDKLFQEEQYMDGLRLRAYLLPKRDAVWWGCSCVRDELDETLGRNQTAALRAATAWVSDPSEEHRRECEKASNAANSSGPGGLLAISAFWSEGSIGPPDALDVPADERLTCQGLAAALMTAAYFGDPTKADDRMTSFFKRGKEVAAGKIPYPSD